LQQVPEWTRETRQGFTFHLNFVTDKSLKICVLLYNHGKQARDQLSISAHCPEFKEAQERNILIVIHKNCLKLPSKEVQNCYDKSTDVPIIMEYLQYEYAV